MNTIGFIGQGWIGKHYADDFEARSFTVVRYSLEEPYVQNKAKISECDIVFVAVPTPTTADGFSYAPVRDALSIITPGSTVVIKSTLYPGTTKSLQKEFPHLFVMHSPEFLREAHAAHDAANPERNLIGLPEDTEAFRVRAQEVLHVLPRAPYERIMSAYDAEMVKYAGNCFLYTKVVFMNILYDLVMCGGGDWEVFRDALINDPRIGASHTEPIHTSGHDSGDSKQKRGAGGHCFIKDFEAFRRLTLDQIQDHGDVHEFLYAMTKYNNRLLQDSGKDVDLLSGVFGEELLPQTPDMLR